MDMNKTTLYVYEMAEIALCNAGVECYTFTDKNFVGRDRPPGACLPDEPIFNALQWAYKSLPRRYDAIINILANCPQHTGEGVQKAIERFEALGVDELRSFNKDGSESGLMILKEKTLLEKHQISTYQGAIELESIEIHTQEDYEKCRKLITLPRSGRIITDQSKPLKTLSTA